MKYLVKLKHIKKPLRVYLVQQYVVNTVLQKQQEQQQEQQAINFEEQKLVSNLDLLALEKFRDQFNALLMRNNGLPSHNMQPIDYFNLMNNMKYFQNNQPQDFSNISNINGINLNINDLNNFIAMKNLQNSNISNLGNLINLSNLSNLSNLNNLNN